MTSAHAVCLSLSAPRVSISLSLILNGCRLLLRDKHVRARREGVAGEWRMHTPLSLSCTLAYSHVHSQTPSSLTLSFSSSGFCVECIKYHMGEEGHAKIVASDKWKCFKCDPSVLKSLLGERHATHTHTHTRSNAHSLIHTLSLCPLISHFSHPLSLGGVRESWNALLHQKMHCVFLYR